MDPALRTAATGMIAQQVRSEVIANNLANVNTTAFKRSRAHFEDLLYQNVQGISVLGSNDAQTTPAIQIGRGTRLSAVQRLHSQGPIEPTSRPLDIAIEGEGFFQIQLGDGKTAYTRDGSFSISDTGALVTADGYALVPPIQVPNDAAEVQVSRTGIVTVHRGDASEPVEIGRIELARFPNPAGLLTIGDNLYSATPASGAPVCGFPQDNGIGRLLQGHLEGSNVEIVQEMVDMIESLRAYEINSKSIHQAEEMMQIANDLIR